MNLAARHLLSKHTLKICSQTAFRCFPRQQPNLGTTFVVPSIQTRKYSEERMESKTLPTLMEFPPIVWPNIVKFIKNWMFATFIIRPYFEPEFSLHDFIEGSKHAVQVVSESLQNSDFQSLEGLVDKEAISALKNAVSKLSVTQRQLLSVTKDDIFYAFPYQVGVMFDDSDKRWVEITMCYHCLRGLKQITESGNIPAMSIGANPEYQDKFFVLNYRFIREFTKGVEDSWWVNIVNHFQPHNMSRKL